MKARARFIDGFVRFGNRRDRKGAAALGDANGTGAPKARLLLAAFAALAATLVLGVALAGAVAPVVTVEDADDVEYTTAHVEGEVNPEGHETSYHFEYITDEQYLANEASSEPLFQGASAVGHGSTESTVSPSETLSDLKPGTEYHLRLVASNNEGETAEAVAASTFTTKAVAKPIVSGLTATETHFSGMVNPNAPEAAPTSGAVKAGFNTHWSFTCSPDCSFAGPSEGDLEADNSATEVSADPVNLTPNQTYDVTLHATNAGGEESETITSAFTTPGLPPEIGNATLLEPTSTSIVLAGTVNPHNSPLSDCHFAYGQAGNLDLSAPCESPLPEGEGIREVRAAIEGLDPGTEYSFRLIATNGFGTAEGTIRSFHTFPGPTSGPACPNEAIRVAQHATHLSDCRAWEMVSPAEKGGGDIVAEGMTVAAAADGDGAVFESRYGFGDTVGAGAVGRTAYFARRGAGGWATHSVTPQSRPDPIQVLNGGTSVDAISPDLSRALVFGYDLPDATGDAPERENLYVEDTGTRSLRTVSSSQRGDGLDPIQYASFEFTGDLWGASDDFSHVSFVSRIQLLPTGTGPGYPQGIALEKFSPHFRYAYTVANAYTWDDGVLHLAGILPDGSLPPEGSTIDPASVRGTMSTDGSRQTFFASPSEGAPRQLYLRIDHNRTVLISESESEAFAEEAQAVFFEGMTPDGRNVFFVTDSPLLEGDQNASPDLYRWTDGPDPASESDNLTLITDNGGAQDFPGSFGGPLIGMSDDATRVYVHDTAGVLKLWEEGSGIRTLAEVPRAIEPGQWLTLLDTKPGLGRVSPDGDWMAYIAHGGVLHVYDRERDTDTAIAENVSLEPTITNGGRKYFHSFRPRFLSEDGQVIFTTREALVPQDVNGVADVYSYDGPTGRLSLVSSGRGDEPMEFADASADGADVLFVTRAPLVPSDHDVFADLYDARVGGGFHEPVPPPAAPCSGETCQPAGNAAAQVPAVSTRAHTRGNVKRGHRRCRHGRRAVRRHGKVRCVKLQRRHAGSNGRGGR